MEAQETSTVMGMTPRVRQLVLETWPNRCASWSEGVWDRWVDQLYNFTETEIEQAVIHYAKQGNEFPPSWGVVYRIATPARRARLDRIAEYQYRRRMEEGR